MKSIFILNSIGERNTLGNSSFSALLLLGHQQLLPFITCGFSNREFLVDILPVSNTRISG